LLRMHLEINTYVGFSNVMKKLSKDFRSKMFPPFRRPWVSNSLSHRVTRHFMSLF